MQSLQVINLSGYIANEKKHIARQYLEPQTRTESGIPEGNATLTDEALTRLITEYCRSELHAFHSPKFSVSITSAFFEDTDSLSEKKQMIESRLSYVGEGRR